MPNPCWIPSRRVCGRNHLERRANRGNCGNPHDWQGDGRFPPHPGQWECGNLAPGWPPLPFRQLSLPLAVGLQPPAGEYGSCLAVRPSRAVREFRRGSSLVRGMGQGFPEDSDLRNAYGKHHRISLPGWYNQRMGSTDGFFESTQVRRAGNMQVDPDP